MSSVPGWMAEVGVELRSALGDEFRAEAEADERAAAALRLRRRSLVDAAIEHMHRGDLVRAYLPDAIVTGTIVNAATGLLTLASRDSGRLHVNLNSTIVLSIVDAPGSDGRSRGPLDPESFLAQLRSIELGGRPVGIETEGRAGRVTGTIRAVARDHALVERDSEPWYLPFPVIVSVWE